MYEKKCSEEKHVDLILIVDKEKRHYFLIKDFNNFMYDHTLHHGKKNILSLLFTSFLYRSVILNIALKLMANKAL